jgi:hypothetical protein
MRTRLTLEMDECVVNGTPAGKVILSWLEPLTHNDILAVSSEWIRTKDFCTRRMVGLEQVGEANLTIEPM